jgi:hypothetical protein
MELNSPVNNTTVSLSVTQSNTQGTLTATGNSNRLLVQNLGDNVAYFRIGTGAQTAVVTDTPIQPFQAFLITYQGETGVAAICDTGLTASLKVSQMYAI